MGRRKKEPESVHRENIAGAAERLFERKGIGETTMDEIAREAGYSKATLYVYFHNKREIVGMLALRSMEMLRDCIRTALAGRKDSLDGYRCICSALVDYQESFPFYFDFAMGEINVNPDGRDWLPVERETYEVGEEINSMIEEFLTEGMEAGELRRDVPALRTVFHFWAMLTGLIRMAAGKEKYLAGRLGLSRQQFLDSGFTLLYQCIGIVS